MKKELWLECTECRDCIFLGDVYDEYTNDTMKHHIQLNECQLSMRSRSNPDKMRGIYKYFFDNHITHALSIFIETREQHLTRRNEWADEYGPTAKPIKN